MLTGLMCSLRLPGDEANIERLLKQVSELLRDLTDEFKVNVANALRSLVDRFPKRVSSLLPAASDEGINVPCGKYGFYSLTHSNRPDCCKASSPASCVKRAAMSSRRDWWRPWCTSWRR